MLWAFFFSCSTFPFLARFQLGCKSFFLSVTVFCFCVLPFAEPFLFRFLHRFFSVFCLGLGVAFCLLSLPRGGKPWTPDLTNLSGPISPYEIPSETVHSGTFPGFTSPDSIGSPKLPSGEVPDTVPFFFRFLDRFFSVSWTVFFSVFYGGGTPVPGTVFFSVFYTRKWKKMKSGKWKKNAQSIFYTN